MSMEKFCSVPGHLICGEDLDILLDAGEGKFAELDIQCCGGGKDNICNTGSQI